MKSIIWLHSNLSNGAEFEEIISQLNRYGFDNKIFHVPKAGGSFDDLFTQLNRTVLSAQKDQVSFVAYSWGAYLALTYLSLNPDHVDRIFLINPLCHDPRPQSELWHKIQTMPFIGKAILIPTTFVRANTHLKKMFSPLSVVEEAQKKLKPFLQSASVWQGASIYQHMVNEFPLSEDLKSFPVPIHALFGNDDGIAPYVSQFPYFQNLVKFSYMTINKAGHALPWTHSDLILKEIKHFFVGD